MSEQQIELNKIKKSIGKVSPAELGMMLRKYHEKYLEPPKTADVYVEALKIFDGGLL